MPGAARLESAQERSRSKHSLRLWLRMLACENLVEHELRARLRDAFGVTLPQFDALAELEHAGGRLTMSALSQELMVSNGNITGVVDRLVRDGYVRRMPSPTDRRVQFIELTEDGLQRFAEMAEAHEAWVTEMMTGLSLREIEQLTRLMRRMQESIKPKKNLRSID